MSNEVRDYLASEVKIWEPDMLLKSHKGTDVVCHIFERTVVLPRHSSQGEYFLPLQMVLAVKEKPGGRLNSHLWYFSAFTRHVQPKYCLVLNSGIKPQKNALVNLHEEMEVNPQAGIAYGELRPLDPRYYNVAESSQIFEYTLAHSLQKPAESFAGYATPFTSGFTIYRWKAIRGEPLNQYFRVEEEGLAALGPFLSNLYLTVDRIIAFETLTKRQRKWRTLYCSAAVAEHKAPDTLISLITTRRRFISGSLFGYMYFLNQSMKIWKRSAHSIVRKLMLTAHTLMNLVYILFYWFAPALVYILMFYIFTNAVSGLGFGTT